MKALVLPGVQAGIGPFESGWILSSMYSIGLSSTPSPFFVWHGPGCRGRRGRLWSGCPHCPQAG